MSARKTKAPSPSANTEPELLPGRGVVPDLHLASWLEGGVRYISDQSFHLVLYAPAHTGECGSWDPSSPPPKFKTPSRWKPLLHQTAGYACHHRYMYARFLMPSLKIKKLGKMLLSKYSGSLLAQPVSLREANEYNNLLAEFGLSADRSFVRLEEGFYPIDIECLPKVTREKFSNDLRRQLVRPLPKYNKRKLSDVLSNWVEFELAILGPNCD